MLVIVEGEGFRGMKRGFVACGIVIVGLSLILALYVYNYKRVVDENQSLKAQLTLAQTENYYSSKAGLNKTKAPSSETKATKAPTSPVAERATTTAAPKPTAPPDTLLYEDSKVSISYVRCQRSTYSMYDYEIVFKVSNKTADTLTIQAESMSLDGVSIPSSTTGMSDEVAPKSTGEIYLKVKGTRPDAPKKISGELRVINFGADTRYSAKFVDVAIKN